MIPGGDTAERSISAFREAEEYLRQCASLRPRVALVLGTGLGDSGEAIRVDVAIPFAEIPHFPEPTVDSHRGLLLLGTLGGIPVAAMQGRLHRYEGHSLQDVTFPLRVLRLLGAETLVVTGLCGGMDPLHRLGDLVLLDDQINLMGDSPLVGPNLDAFGPRFPDMSEPFDRELQELALDAALRRGIRLERGVYAGVVGPNLETRAEYRMLRLLGAHVVGMSIVPEVVVARHMGMRVLGLCIVSDLCNPDALDPVDVPSILRVAAEAGPGLSTVIRDVVRTL